MITDEKELISMLNYSELLYKSDNVKYLKTSFTNINLENKKTGAGANSNSNGNGINSNSLPIDSDNSVLNEIRNKYSFTKNNDFDILYPFNHIFEFIVHSDEIILLEKNKESIREEIEEVNIINS